jgi:hypothetical protein
VCIQRYNAFQSRWYKPGLHKTDAVRTTHATQLVLHTHTQVCLPFDLLWPFACNHQLYSIFQNTPVHVSRHLLGHSP